MMKRETYASQSTAISNAMQLMRDGYTVHFYPDRQDGLRIFVVEYKK